MRLSSRPLQGDPISSKTRRVAALLAREKTGEILARLRSRPYLAASELARLEDIHIATAQRYLQELLETDLVGVRRRSGANRPTQEYWLREPHIRIDIDLQGLPGLSEDELLGVAKRLGVRDAGNTQIVYDAHPETGVVQGILVLSDKPPRLVSRRLGVASSVGRFLSRLPGRTEAHDRVWDVMQQAGLGVSDLPAVLASLDRFSSPVHVEDPEGVPPVPQGSARPVDPDLKRIFEELSVGTEAKVESPPVPVLDVCMLEPGPGLPADDGEPGGRRPEQRLQGRDDAYVATTAEATK